METLMYIYTVNGLAYITESKILEGTEISEEVLFWALKNYEEVMKGFLSEKQQEPHLRVATCLVSIWYIPLHCRPCLINPSRKQSQRQQRCSEEKLCSDSAWSWALHSEIERNISRMEFMQFTNSITKGFPFVTINETIYAYVPILLYRRNKS